MPRLFNDASSEKIQLNLTVVTDEPATFVCAFRSDTIADLQFLVGVSEAAASGDRFSSFARGNIGGDPLNAEGVGTVGASADTSTGYSANTWHHMASVYVSDTERNCFIDGGSKGSNTTDIGALANLNRTTIGVLVRDIDAAFMSGDIGWVAIWTAALSDVVVAALGRGVNPFAVQPADRVFLAPLHGHDSPEAEYDQQNTLTLTGTTKSSSNPPVELLEVYL